MADTPSIFEKMSKTILQKQDHHAEKRALYEGLHKAPNVRVSKDPKITAYASRSLGWPAKAVDYLVSDCSFDGFLGDEFGATRLLVELGGDRAILSAETNAAIGGVAFVALFPRSSGRPALVTYTGAEATGIYNELGTELRYGLAAKKIESGKVSEWYLFEPGWIHILNSVGDTIDSLDLGVDVMAFVPFCYDRDPATRPFGHSRITPDAIEMLDLGLTSIGLSSMLMKLNIIRNDLLLIKGSPQNMRSEKKDAQAGDYTIIWLDGVDGVDGAKVDRTPQVDIKEIGDSFNRAGEQFASSVSMLPVSFGIQPANGSYSTEVLNDMQKPYHHTLTRARLSYSDSIKQLAIAAFKLVAQTDEVDALDSLQTSYNTVVDPARMGAIGDAFGKIKTAADAIGMSVDKDFWRQQIGQPLRGELMQQDLPDFERARARFREVIIDKV